MSVLKTRSGWESRVKAPFWTLLIVWAQLTILFLVLSALILMVADNPVATTDVRNFVIVSVLGSSVIIIAVLIILSLMKLIHRIVRKIGSKND